MEQSHDNHFSAKSKKEVIGKKLLNIQKGDSVIGTEEGFLSSKEVDANCKLSDS